MNNPLAYQRIIEMSYSNENRLDAETRRREGRKHLKLGKSTARMSHYQCFHEISYSRESTGSDLLSKHQASA